MKKGKMNIVKEVFIMIVLILLITLILAVALYDFIPNDINISEAIEYTADSSTTSVKQEIAYTNRGDTTADDSLSDQEMVTSLKSYSVEASDLTVYGQKNLYNSGNSNPFDYAEEATTNNQNTTTQQPESNTTNNAGGTSNTANVAEPSQNTNTNTPPATNSTVGTFFENPTSK